MLERGWRVAHQTALGRKVGSRGTTRRQTIRSHRKRCSSAVSPWSGWEFCCPCLQLKLPGPIASPGRPGWGSSRRCGKLTSNPTESSTSFCLTR
eukprot:3186541-Prymnesium_polylepis.1